MVRVKLQIILACAIVCSICHATSWAQDSGARLGINLAGPADWNTELPFVDVFHFSRTWISQKQGEKWGSGPSLDLDEHGWVKKLDANCWVDTLLCTIDGGHYPSGMYTILYEGHGELRVQGTARPVGIARPGRMVIQVDSTKGGFFLSIRATDPADYIRNIRVIMPGFEQRYQTEQFNPTFLRRWKGVACFRFMDWMMTNGSTLAHWQDRPRVEDANYTTTGIPLEVMIDLCNQQKADGWFCMPAQADDDYIRNFAQLVKKRLDPSLKAYVEYSNEVWNSSFDSHRYAQEQGAKLSLGDPKQPWEGACFFYGKRASQIFSIWRDVFGNRPGLVRVLAWQAAADDFWLDKELFNEIAPGSVDALAIAPYMAFMPHPGPDQKDGPTADQVDKWTVDQVLDFVGQKSLPQCIEWIRRAEAAAQKHHVKLIAYESGQHLVGVLGAENDDALTKLFGLANQDPRMANIYHRYFTAWQANGGGLLCHFSSVSVWSKWGSWGLLQHQDDQPTTSPKFMATIDWAKSLGQPMTR